MGTSWNRIDANLIAANIKSGVQIYGITGTASWWWQSAIWAFWYFLGTRWFDDDGNPVNGVWKRTIELWNFIYCFAICRRWPGGSSQRWAACIAAKIHKNTWLLTIIWSVSDSASSSWTSPSVVSSYINWNIIYVNCKTGANELNFALNTTNDALSVNSGIVTLWVLTNTTQVIIAWIAYETESIQPSFWVAAAGFSWYLAIHETPYVYDSIWIEINTPSNTLIRDWWFFMKPDWTWFYIQNVTFIEQYSLSIAWDLSTYSRISQTSLNRFGLFWNSNWQYQYSVLWHTTDRVYRKTASTPWLLSSLWSEQSYNPSAQCADVKWVWLKSDGTKMYLIDNWAADWFWGTNTIYQYSLSTPWQISSWVTYDAVSYTVTPQDNNAKSITFSVDWLKLYICWAQYNRIYEYNLSVARDLSTIVYNNKYISYMADNANAPMAISFKPDMSKAYIANNFNTGLWVDFNVTQYSST